MKLLELLGLTSGQSVESSTEIYRLLEGELGPRARFFGSFEIPLTLVALNADLRDALMRGDLASSGGPGAQDAEQSIPFFIDRGLDIPDWVEAAAPRPYAIVATTEDMFPIAGARAAYAEARRFYEVMGAADKITMIEGPGPHGNLGPIAPRIIGFFNRWLKGSPYVLLRNSGNWIEVSQRMNVPTNCGTPGLPNSRLLANAGPAIRDVSHLPILPAANEAVVVRARVSDPDGISSVTLRYRTDPATSYSSAAMRDHAA